MSLSLLDNVLSPSTAPAQLCAFLCTLFTRIRTNEQTAFLLATEDMHHPAKTAVLTKFPDAAIEHPYYTTFDIERDMEMEHDHKRSRAGSIGRQPNFLIEEAIAIPT